MIRAQKVKKAQRLQSSLEEGDLIVVVHHKGLDAQETTKLRRKVHENEVRYHVVRNRSMPFVLDEKKLNNLLPMFQGPAAIFVSRDETSAARIAQECAKESGKIEILGGTLGDKMLDAAKVGAIACLPSLDVMRASLVGLIQRPASLLAAMAQAPASAIIGVTAAQGRS